MLEEKVDAATTGETSDYAYNRAIDDVVDAIDRIAGSDIHDTKLAHGSYCSNTGRPWEECNCGMCEFQEGLGKLADWLSPDVCATHPVEFSATALNQMRNILSKLLRDAR